MTGIELGASNVVLARKIFDLPCNDGRKSFYDKASVIECKNGVKLLKSYDTLVCGIDEHNDVFRLWNGYSVTTMRHVNAFLAFYGIMQGGKAYWNSLKINQYKEVC